jgi:hypothetical protein
VFNPEHSLPLPCPDFGLGGAKQNSKSRTEAAREQCQINKEPEGGKFHQGQEIG